MSESDWEILKKQFVVEIDEIILKDLINPRERKKYILGEIHIKIKAELTKDFRALIATDTE